jgi:DNA-binding NarL/FixJ family response regulator
VTQARKRISLVLVNGIPGREEIASLIRAQPGFHVLAPSADMKETLRQLRATRPDIVLLNLPQGAKTGLRWPERCIVPHRSHE